MGSFLSRFLAPAGRYPACGMFTRDHIIAAAACILVSAACALILGRRLRKRTIHKLALAAAVILTLLECVKIGHAFYYGSPAPDAWIPLSFCSIFTVSLWLYRFCDGAVGKAAETYIAFAAPLAGLCFMIFPTTSLMSYPIWHFLSVFSMLFHSLMIFIGLTLFLRKRQFTLFGWISYTVYISLFGIVAIALNRIIGTNLMNLREPYNIPISPIQALYSASPRAFTIIVLAAYIAVPIFTAAITGRIRRGDAG